MPRDCATSHYKRVIHDPTVWRFLQETYLQTVDQGWYADRRKTLSSYSGFRVSVEVKDDGPRGRSIYAAEPISKGTQVWKATHLVDFRSPSDLRNFLGHLDHDLQCDALLWAYVEKGEGLVSLALDPASFVNHGETNDIVNLDKDCVAVRDIGMGEELLENYTHFIGFEEVEWYNQIRGLAWQEGSLGHHRAGSTDEYNLLGAPKVVWGPQPDALFPVVALLVLGMLVTRKFVLLRSFKKEKESL